MQSLATGALGVGRVSAALNSGSFCGPSDRILALLCRVKVSTSSYG